MKSNAQRVSRCFRSENPRKSACCFTALEVVGDIPKHNYRDLSVKRNENMTFVAIVLTLSPP